jgi:hypothetical protein
LDERAIARAVDELDDDTSSDEGGDENEVDQLQDFEDIADDIGRDRICDSTKKAYAGKIKKWKEWLREHHPHTIDHGGQIILPLDDNVVMGFFGFKAYRNPVARTGLYSKSTTEQFYSALKDEYRNREVFFPVSTQKKVLGFLDGLKRTIATAREKGEMSVSEGKRALPIGGFRAISQHSLRTHSDDHLFVHLYAILCWNLIARTSSVGSIMYQHIWWENDCLIIQIPRHKGDQEGAKVFPKHIFANPLNPSICPVLALALHVFSVSFIRPGAALKLFNSPSIEANFSRWLKAALSHQDITDIVLGVPADEVGTHSFR